MRLAELLKLATLELKLAGVAEDALDARILLESCLSMTRTEIFLEGQAEVGEDAQKRFFAYVSRRKLREPLAYILGEQEFWSMPFFVNDAVLIPRPETEFLLDRVFSLVEPQNLVRGGVLDLCCGSGVIAAVLAKETHRKIIATDISSAALAVAKKNIRRHNLLEQVGLACSNLFSAFHLKPQFSLIVANPPYVASDYLKDKAEPEVGCYEPILALDGGARGLEIIQKIRHDLPGYLCPGGQFFMEIGADQGTEVRCLFNEKPEGFSAFDQVEILVDFTGRDRVLHARRVVD